MPLQYWDEAYLAATYLINRTRTKVLDFSTPLERLFSEQPDYSMLRIFWCACWPKLKPYNTHKLAFRSLRCLFLGYSSLHKGFKCQDVSTRRIYISRDVIFNENIFPFSELHDNAGATLRSQIDLLPPHLHNFSTPMSMTPACTDVAKSSNNLRTSSASNSGGNGAPDSGFQDSIQDAPNAEHEADPLAHSPDLAGKSASSSVPDLMPGSALGSH